MQSRTRSRQAHRHWSGVSRLENPDQRGRLWLLRSGRQSDNDYEYAAGDPVTSFDLGGLCSTKDNVRAHNHH